MTPMTRMFMTQLGFIMGPLPGRDGQVRCREYVVRDPDLRMLSRVWTMFLPPRWNPQALSDLRELRPSTGSVANG